MLEIQAATSTFPRTSTTLIAILNRYPYAIPFLLFSLVLPFYYLAWSAPGVGLSHDDGIYLATAKALATGRGYTILSLPNEIAQTKYPILFPLLLSILWRIDPNFPQNIGFLKLIPLLSTLAWMIGVYRLARELSASRQWALCLTACVLATPWVVSFSGQLSSETTFAAFATWTVVFLWRAERSGRLRTAVWAALLVSAAYYTRTAALAIIAGGFFGLLLARRFRATVAFTLTAGITCLPWVIWQAQQKVLPPIERYYTSLCYRHENVLLYFNWHEKITIFQRNLEYLFVAPCVLFGFPITPISIAVSGLFWLTCAIGLQRMRSRCFQCVAMFSILMPALWAWAPFRFLFPAEGLLLLAAYSAFDKRLVKVTAMAVFLVAVSGSLWSLWSESRRTELVSIEFEHYPSTWAEVMNVQNWIRSEASPGDVVISALDPLVYLYTNLKSVRGFYSDARPVYYGLPAETDAGKEFLRVLDRYEPKYLVQMQPDFYETRYLGHITSALIQAGYVVEVHRAGSLHVYKVVKVPPSSFVDDNAKSPPLRID